MTYGSRKTPLPVNWERNEISVEDANRENLPKTKAPGIFLLL
jgi:hypothetical protein